jgi:hypothetical protein
MEESIILTGDMVERNHQWNCSLKKGRVFAIPTLVTYEIKSLHAFTSDSMVENGLASEASDA